MKIIFKLFQVYFTLLLIFVSLLFLVHLIPSSGISKNVAASVSVIEKEGLYPNIMNFKLFQLDNYTDSMMLNIAVSVENDKPMNSAMLNYYFTSGQYLDLAKDARKVADGDTLNLHKESYARYWHGYLGFLRPLLLFLNYNQIRILNFIAFFILLLMIGISLYKKLGISVLIIFLSSLVFINFPIVPLSMQFSSVFYIAFGGIIYVLKKKSKYWTKELFFSFFFILGGLTSFFDFLTTPMITLGLPLTIYILINDEFSNSKKVTSVLTGSLTWASGYGIIWASKWFVGYLITGVNILESAKESAALRVSNQWNGMEMTISNIFKFMAEKFSEMDLWMPIIISVSLFLFVYTYLNKGIQAIGNNMYLLMIVLMVPIWYLILRNHSIQHGWFTWRASIVSIFSGLLFLSKTTDHKGLTKRFRIVSNPKKE